MQCKAVRFVCVHVGRGHWADWAFVGSANLTVRGATAAAAPFTNAEVCQACGDRSRCRAYSCSVALSAVYPRAAGSGGPPGMRFDWDGADWQARL